MASIETIAPERPVLDPEEKRVVSWRHATLLAEGYEPRYAFAFALRREVDLHLAVRLRRAGCPSATAARILL